MIIDIKKKSRLIEFSSWWAFSFSNSRNHPHEPFLLTTKPYINITESDYNGEKWNFFLVHGFIGHYTDPWVVELADQLLELVSIFFFEISNFLLFYFFLLLRHPCLISQSHYDVHGWNSITLSIQYIRILRISKKILLISGRVKIPVFFPFFFPV